MANEINPPQIDRLDRDSLDLRLRGAAQHLQPDRMMDEMEVRHLVRVITECSLVQTDVYSEERIARIMHAERGFLDRIVHGLIDRQRRGEGEALYRVRRLPDDVRLIGDKALFDLGLLGLERVKGYDIHELGSRAYLRAGEALEMLADDRRLRRFFDENRLLMLPLEEEIVFLRQCSENFRIYADILRETQNRARPTIEALDVDLQTPEPDGVRSTDLEAAAGYAHEARSREHEISAYERILLFSSLRIERLKAALNETVIDQQGAVDALCDEFCLFSSGTLDLRRPAAYFLVGPTGVGKNHLVETLCRLLEGVWSIDVPILTIEGPNYTYPSDINELRGATRGFIRSDEEGLLTTFHKRSSQAPFSVILIDEVEKAHSQLTTFFLSILDRGTTTDNRGNVLDFSNCMLFFTSNLGYSDAQQGSSRIGYVDREARKEAEDGDIRRDLRRALKPEFVNRVRMIHFDRLTRASAERILDLEFDRISRRYLEIHGLEIELDASAREELIGRGFSESFGARHLRKTLERICNVEIARKIRQDDRAVAEDRTAVIDWLRQMRSGERAYDEEQVRSRVLGLARAELEYERLVIVFSDGEFEYLPVDRNPS